MRLSVKKFVGCGIACGCLILLCAESFAQTEISGILKTEKTVWATSAKEISDQFPGKELFKWMDSSQSGLRYSADSSPEKIIFSGLPVYEAVFSVKNEKISKIYLSLFNRGDAGSLEKNDYNELLKKLNGVLEKLAGKKGGKETVSIIGGKRFYSKRHRCGLS